MKLKKLKRVYLRPQDTPFVWLSSFVFNAEKQKWTKAEIQAVVQSVKSLKHDEVYQFLTQMIEK